MRWFQQHGWIFLPFTNEKRPKQECKKRGLRFRRVMFFFLQGSLFAFYLMEKDFLNKRCFIHSWIILLISSLALTHIYDEMFGAKIIIRTSSSSSGIKIAKRFVLSPSCHPFPIRLLWPHPSICLFWFVIPVWHKEIFLYTKHEYKTEKNITLLRSQLRVRKMMKQKYYGWLSHAIPQRT